MSGIRPLPSVTADSLKQAYEVGNGQNVDAGFGNLLGELVSSTDQVFDHVNELERSLVAGEATDVHDVMIANAEATVTFSLMVEIRNKLMEAYNELMRLQV